MEYSSVCQINTVNCEDNCLKLSSTTSWGRCTHRAKTVSRSETLIQMCCFGNQGLISPLNSLNRSNFIFTSFLQIATWWLYSHLGMGSQSSVNVRSGNSNPTHEGRADVHSPCLWCSSHQPRLQGLFLMQQQHTNVGHVQLETNRRPHRYNQLISHDASSFGMAVWTTCLGSGTCTRDISCMIAPQILYLGCSLTFCYRQGKWQHGSAAHEQTIEVPAASPRELCVVPKIFLLW